MYSFQPFQNTDLMTSENHSPWRSPVQTPQAEKLTPSRHWAFSGSDAVCFLLTLSQSTTVCDVTTVAWLYAQQITRKAVSTFPRFPVKHLSARCLQKECFCPQSGYYFVMSRQFSGVHFNNSRLMGAWGGQRTE